MALKLATRQVLIAAIIIPAFLSLLSTTPSFAATTSSMVPKANAVWAYDPRDANGQLQAGAFVDAINQYNLLANSGHRIREIYSYGGDMEMYCPGNVVANCTSSDLYVFYSRTQPVSGQTYSNVSTYAYDQGINSDLLDGPPLIMPIIDGVVTGSGPLGGFNDLSPKLARQFADKVAHRICADPYAAGVEFDLEPFNVQTRNGQYYFFLRIGRDFAVAQTGCVDSNHPNGRYFAIFASANAINPNTASAGRVGQILTRYHNGYLIDPLYDLSSEPPGYRTSATDYQRLVDAQTANMANWAKQLGIPYQFGIPGAASFHEYETCSGPACAGAAEPADGQVSYIMADENAIDASFARTDGLYLGSSVWSFTAGIKYGQTTFTPQTPTDAVENYLAGTL